MAAVAALLASSLLHVGAMAIAPEFADDIRIQGSAAEQAAALGSNFADLVKAGDELDPAETEQDTTTEPVVTRPIQPAETQADVTPPAPPESYAAVTTPQFKIEPSRTEGLIPPSPVEKLQAVEPALVVSQPAPEAVEQPAPKPAEASIRPVETTQSFAPVEELEVVPTPTPKPEQKKPRKVSKRKQTTAGSSKAKSTANAKSGSQNGKESAKAATTGKSQKTSSSSNSGNAAASSYPGKVYARIARTRLRNAGAKGAAQVRFTVSPSGQAVSVSVARSSGNAEVDRAAVAHVKRASPFAKPPPGAQTRFVIPIEFRR